LHSLPQVVEGEIGAVVEALQKADLERKLAELTGQPYDPRRGAAGEDEE
jgi:hypothetical protein